MMLTYPPRTRCGESAAMHEDMHRKIYHASHSTCVLTYRHRQEGAFLVQRGDETSDIVIHFQDVPNGGIYF